MRAGNIIARHCSLILENRRQAIAYAAILSVLPFVSWLSVALICLITLRKGARSGFDVLLPALVVHLIPLMMLVPLSSAILNGLIAYLPCYLAALVLRKTEKWQMVSGVLFFQAFLACLLLQLLAPEFIVMQFAYFKSVLTQYQEFIEAGMDNISSPNLAQLFWGIQLLSALVSALISLMFARSIQARLFLPGGFKSELLGFRSGKFSLFVLIGVSIGAYYEIPLAINVLPIMLCYFLVSGFGLAYFILARKNQAKVFVLLILLILLKPTLVLFAYIVFGSLDSLFNFRMYLPERVRDSI